MQARTLLCERTVTPKHRFQPVLALTHRRGAVMWPSPSCSSVARTPAARSRHHPSVAGSRRWSYRDAPPACVTYFIAALKLTALAGRRHTHIGSEICDNKPCSLVYMCYVSTHLRNRFDVLFPVIRKDVTSSVLIIPQQFAPKMKTIWQLQPTSTAGSPTTCPPKQSQHNKAAVRNMFEQTRMRWTG